MAPRVRKPLAVASNPVAKDQLKQQLIDIFDKSQYCTSSDLALTQLKKLYKNTPYNKFEPAFRNIFKRFLQSKDHSNYFKTTCELVCKFLEHENKTNETTNNDKTTLENQDQNKKDSNKKRSTRKGVKRKERETSDDDELVSEYLQTSQTSQLNITDEDLAPITDIDRIISSCIEVADIFMQAANEDCRLNAVYFVCKFLTHVQSLDEEIFKALQMRLTERIRDKKPRIRAQAVLASHTLQANKMIQDAFNYHFYRDPELIVRKALLQVMDTKIFGYNFLADSTQDSHELMRVTTYQKIGKVSPKDLNQEQLHKILHNGLNERERRANYAFKTNTLEIWLTSLYNGINLQELLNSFDCIEYYDDICKLLQIIYERDLEKIENNGTTTKLHHVVENFRETNFDDNCIPKQMSNVDEKLIIIWTTLVKFCRNNQSLIKPVKIRTIAQVDDKNASIEKILDSQEKTDDVVELYERLTPDLINLVEFLKNFVEHAHKKLGNNGTEKEITKFEFIYQHIMSSILYYDVGDELERKSVQEVLGGIIKENLLTGQFKNFIRPVIKCLNKLIYSANPNLMLNYISELINNVRSHLEDVIATTAQPKLPAIRHSTIMGPRSQDVPKSVKKVRINDPLEGEDLECEIAKRRVELEELKDNLENCIKDKDYDKAKVIDSRMKDIKSQLTMLHERRYSIASDVSHMSMVLDIEPCGSDGKLSSTVIAETSLNDSEISIQNDEEVKIFKHHTNDLIKCLQMYFACLENINIREVPQTMLNHLNLLSYECLDEWFKENSRVRSLMVACNGISALIDKNFAKVPNTITLLLAACFDTKSIEVKTTGFISLVDVLVEHEDLEYSEDNIEKFLHLSMRDYGKFNAKDSSKTEMEFANALIEGTSKLFYYKKLSSPKVLSHFILWWYHPKTDSKLRQFIGVFLPLFVRDSSKKQICLDETINDTWLKDLLEDTFIMSIEYLHNYITGPGFNIMESSDMLSLINFLSNLIPIAFHPDIQVKLNERIDEISDKSPDLVKYLKQAKNGLTLSAPTTTNNVPQTPLARRIDTTINNN